MRPSQSTMVEEMGAFDLCVSWGAPEMSVDRRSPLPAQRDHGSLYDCGYQRRDLYLHRVGVDVIVLLAWKSVSQMTHMIEKVCQRTPCKILA